MYYTSFYTSYLYKGYNCWVLKIYRVTCAWHVSHFLKMVEEEALTKSFLSELDIKNLGEEKIIGMKIWRDMNYGVLYVIQRRYIEKVLHCFPTDHAKDFFTLLDFHVMHSKGLVPRTKKNEDEIKCISYTNVIEMRWNKWSFNNYSKFNSNWRL